MSQEGWLHAGGVELGWRSYSPVTNRGLNSDANPTRAGAKVEQGRLGEVPGAKAERLRGLAGAMAWPSCWTAAAQSYGAAVLGVAAL